LLELLVRIGFVNICQAVADVELTTLLEWWDLRLVKTDPVIKNYW
jgi:hypothetical protein